eukprot:COSAG04_NODE_1711_length_5840_cov_27.422923_8_plen_65_part_00
MQAIAVQGCYSAFRRQLDHRKDDTAQATRRSQRKPTQAQRRRSPLVLSLVVQAADKARAQVGQR